MPKAAAPAAAEATEQQHRKQVQTEAGPDAPSGGDDGQDKTAAGARRHKKQSKQTSQAVDS